VRVLIDECLPRRLRLALPGHDVSRVADMGWAGTRNGALLRLAAHQFDAFITIDQNLRFQQELRGLSLAVVMLAARSNRMSALEPLVPSLLRALDFSVPGQVTRVPTAG
jgi:hypothetical protein